MTVRCPVCKKKVTWEGNRHAPFCSERCRMTDLGAWASGQYTIPSPEESEKEKNREEHGEDQKDQEKQ